MQIQPSQQLHCGSCAQRLSSVPNGCGAFSGLAELPESSSMCGQIEASYILQIQDLYYWRESILSNLLATVSKSRCFLMINLTGTEIKI